MVYNFVAIGADIDFDRNLFCFASVWCFGGVEAAVVIYFLIDYLHLMSYVFIERGALSSIELSGRFFAFVGDCF